MHSFLRICDYYYFTFVLEKFEVIDRYIFTTDLSIMKDFFFFFFLGGTPEACGSSLAWHQT